jgi:hypothetical protein
MEAKATIRLSKPAVLFALVNITPHPTRGCTTSASVQFEGSGFGVHLNTTPNWRLESRQNPHTGKCALRCSAGFPACGFTGLSSPVFKLAMRSSVQMRPWIRIKLLQTVNDLRIENALLRQKIDFLVKRVFGSSSEQLDKNQMELPAQPETSATRRARRPARECFRSWMFSLMQAAFLCFEKGSQPRSRSSVKSFFFDTTRAMVGSYKFK